MPYFKSAGEKLKEIRLAAGIGVRELARRIDFSSSYISKVEKGDKRGSVDFYLKCAEVLNVSTGDFFENQKLPESEELKLKGVDWVLLFNKEGITEEQVLEWVEEYKRRKEK